MDSCSPRILLEPLVGRGSHSFDGHHYSWPVTLGQWNDVQFLVTIAEQKWLIRCLSAFSPVSGCHGTFSRFKWSQHKCGHLSIEEKSRHLFLSICAVDICTDRMSTPISVVIGVTWRRTNTTGTYVQVAYTAALVLHAATRQFCSAFYSRKNKDTVETASSDGRHLVASAVRRLP